MWDILQTKSAQFLQQINNMGDVGSRKEGVGETGVEEDVKT